MLLPLLLVLFVCIGTFLLLLIGIMHGLGLPVNMEMRGHPAHGWLGGTLVDIVLNDANRRFERAELESSERVVVNDSLLGWDKRLHNHGRLFRRLRGGGDIFAIAIAAMIVIARQPSECWHGM